MSRVNPHSAKAQADFNNILEETFVPREEVHTPRADTAHVEPHVQEHETPRKRVRRRKHTSTEDMFYVPIEEIPEGLTYEWKRWAVAGEHNPYYIAEMQSQGWEPVPPKRHPHWVPPGYKEPHIIKNGMILMDRPVELTLEAKREQEQLARRQIIEAEQRLGHTRAGELSREKPKVTKEYFRPVQMEE